MIKVSTNKKFLYIYPTPTEDKGKILIFLTGQQPLETEVIKGKSTYWISKDLRHKVKGVLLI